MRLPPAVIAELPAPARGPGATPSPAEMAQEAIDGDGAPGEDRAPAAPGRAAE